MKVPYRPRPRVTHKPRPNSVASESLPALPLFTKLDRQEDGAQHSNHLTNWLDMLNLLNPRSSFFLVRINNAPNGSAVMCQTPAVAAPLSGASCQTLKQLQKTTLALNSLGRVEQRPSSHGQND